MTTAPQDRIREHLERRGGATEVEVLRLLRTWGADDATPADRRLVADALAGAGIAVTPDLLTAAPGTTMRLTLENAPDREGATRAHARVKPSSAPADDEPVEIPPELPRLFVVAGAVLLMVALFLPWFGASRGVGTEIPDLSSGWQWLSVLDVCLAAIAVLAVAQLATDGFGELGARAVAVTAIVAMAATTARLVSPPTDILPGLTVEVARKVGPFAALLALALIVVGAGLRTSPSLSREGTVLPDGQAPEEARN